MSLLTFSKTEGLTELLRADRVDTIIEDLSKHGEFMLFQLIHGNNRWFCRIRLNDQATGVRIEIEGKGPTVRECVLDCRENFRKATKG